MEKEILTLAMELGEVTPGEEGGLALCCTLALEELAGMLKPGVTPAQCGLTFQGAAAKLALGDWLALRAGNRPRRFSAGELTVEEGTADPQLLRQQGLRQMAHWLADPAFFLREVRG